MDISIIIPTLNEESTIEETLKKLLKNISPANFVREIIVVDANSTDNTQALVKNFKTISLLNSKRGRPQQMNFGAQHAKGSILYFLHADSTPPKNFDQHITKALSYKHLAGCFKMKFDSNHPWMTFISWLTKFNYRACRGGDQSLFVSKTLFHKLGGYDESYPIFEDHEILAKLYKHTTFKVIQKPLISSSRRFKEKGILKLQLLFWAIYFKKWLGASPEALFKFYKKHID